MLNAEAVAAGAQTDLDDLGVAKNAREEKLAARKKSKMTPEEIKAHMEMERLYRQQVLKEQPTIQIQGLGGPEEGRRPGSHAQGRRVDKAKGHGLGRPEEGPAGRETAGPFLPLVSSRRARCAPRW